MLQVDRPNLTCRGTITVELVSGKHFTYRIHRWEEKELWIVSLLRGPNNEADYKAFALVNDKGVAVTFRKCRTEAYLKHAQLLNGEADGHVVEWLQEAYCRACGRKLTHPKSIRLGIGPECGKRE
jgi:hypothetical protein